MDLILAIAILNRCLKPDLAYKTYAQSNPFLVTFGTESCENGIHKVKKWKIIYLRIRNIKLTNIYLKKPLKFLSTFLLYIYLLYIHVLLIYYQTSWYKWSKLLTCMTSEKRNDTMLTSGGRGDGKSDFPVLLNHP